MQEMRNAAARAVADTFLLRMDVFMAGDYTGMLYEKFGEH